MDIIVAIDGNDIMNLCVLGYSECDSVAPCAMHNEWKTTKENFFASLSKKNILDVAKEIKKDGYKAA
jgi:DNA-binding IscR family transcriptional regulator